MSGLVFTLILAATYMGILNSILTNNLGFDTVGKEETWHGRIREGRWSVEVFVKRLGEELQFFLPDASVPKEVCEKVVKKLSAKLYSFLMKEAFNPEYIKVIGPTPSFCYYCLESIYMPFRCHRCGGFFCSGHRLPEKHNCPGGEGERARITPLVEVEEESVEKPKKTILVKEIPCG